MFPISSLSNPIQFLKSWKIEQDNRDLFNFSHSIYFFFHRYRIIIIYYEQVYKSSQLWFVDLIFIVLLSVNSPSSIYFKPYSRGHEKWAHQVEISHGIPIIDQVNEKATFLKLPNGMHCHTESRESLSLQI